MKKSWSPFNPNITINYYIDNPDLVSIKILNLNGRYVANLVSKFAASGNHLINWEPSKKVPSGIYIVEFKYGNQLFAKKINYIK